MYLKKRYSKLSLYLVFLVVLIRIVIAAGELDPNTGDYTYSDEEQAARDALSQANSNANIPPGSTVTRTADGFTVDQGPITIGGQTYGGTNIQLDSNGNIRDADSLDRPNGNTQTNLQNGEDTPDGYRFDNADRSTSTTPDGTTVTANGVTNGRYYDNGNYELESVDSLQHGTVTIINGVNVRFYNGELTADHADSFIRDRTISTNIDDLISVPEHFYVGKADSVLAGCLTINNVEETTFTKTGDIVEMEPAQGVVLDIEDCNYAETEFEALTNNSKLTVEDDKYTITEGELLCKGDSSNETLTANKSADAYIDPAFCFECTNITAVGSYFYDAGNVTTNFGFKVFDYSFRLCVRKDITQRFDLCSQCGIIDVVDKKISLDGAGFSYLRYPVLFYESSFSLVFPLLKPVYESFDLSNGMEMLFDGNMIIGNLSLENFETGEGNISVSAAGSHRVIEIPGTRFLF